MSSPASAPTLDTADRYTDTRRRIDALLDGPTDWVSAMATVACELHHSFAHYDWTGFYRAVSDEELLVGPYQGPHGCLHIDVGRGVCGAAAQARETQLWADVSEAPDHIACQSSTQSEIVVPVLTPSDDLLAVLDVDSDTRGAFDATDQKHLEALCQDLGERFDATGMR
ncbi:GAF domain-containing protein [Salinibacter altiplanensis]|uniref:GAF domain-containing protein n=1 Tax=Salinibacter altiplanensis TaxID=1803181 RepID=UPI000C9F5E3B|nr:GAF domain-containing protein [Salinibacter altiplanensis]